MAASKKYMLVENRKAIAQIVIYKNFLFGLVTNSAQIYANSCL